MISQYNCKVIYHFVYDGKKIKQIQIFREYKDAVHWAAIQETRGFGPVSVEDNTNIDEGMRHIGDNAPQVHMGHYSA